MSIIAQLTYQYKTVITPAQVIVKVYIQFVDSTTNRPVNGEGITVYYLEDLNGIATPKQISIEGQSTLIYNGLYSSASFHSSWLITGQSDSPDPAPPVNQCDLQINYITVDKPESSPGAADAQITVSADSSYLPIQYSLDNVNFQASPTFTGLIGGAHTVFCTDANSFGCNKFQTVTIPITQNLLTSDPSVTLTPNNISRWNAAFNPIVFTYQRKDFEVTGVTINNANGNARIFVNADMSAISTAIATNQAVITNAAAQGITLLNNQNIYIYLNAGPYKGVFSISDADSNSITINKPFTTSATGFVNIDMLRPYYKMLTNITYVDPLTDSVETITSVNRPNNQGTTKADISNFLQSLLRAKDTSNYTQTNFRDSNLSASYTIQYAEQYDDYTTPGNTITSPFISIAAPYYVMYTARQIQSKYSGNLAQYVPFPTSQQAKWVTDFIEPVYTNGYPFDISFIYSEALAGRRLYYKIIPLDVNRQPLSSNTTTSYLLNDDSSWLLNQDASKMVIASQDLFNTPIVEQVGLNRMLVNTNFDNNVYYFTIALFYDNTDSNPIQVTQTQTIRVDHTPDINSVYMRWIGLTGSKQLIE
jgi:hypothetical protein